MRNFRFLLWFFLMFLSAFKPAFADVIQFGAATRCGNADFEIAAVVQHNEEFSIVTRQMTGLRTLAKGTHELTCRLGDLLTKASVRVFGGTNGECMGAGYVDIKNLRVGSVTLSTKGPFNWACMGRSEMLVKLRIYLDQKELRVERCSTKDWGWEHGYVGLECKNFPLTSQVQK